MSLLRLRRAPFAAAVALVAAAPTLLAAQSVDLAAGGVGLSIGDSREITGVRLNFRDSRLRRVDGINATIWSPHGEARGRVSGLALGLPLTGAREVQGLGVGVLGLGTQDRMQGIMIGGLGAGAGSEVHGIALGGLGVGAGGRVSGIAAGGLGVGAGEGATGLLVGGLGVGSGGSVRGIAIGGLGVGAGDDVHGLLVGGLGAGAGKNLTGIAFGGAGVGTGGRLHGIALSLGGVGSGGKATGLMVGGLGAGAGGGLKGIGVGGLGFGSGGDVTGAMVGGLGAGAGGDVTGVAIGGLGVGSGGTLKWVSIGGVGVGAQEIRGIAISPIAVGAQDMTALALAGAYLRIEGGDFRGVGTGAFTDIRGTQRGLTIGIVNKADELRGVQLGLINVARHGGIARWLPIVNWGRYASRRFTTKDTKASPLRVLRGETLGEISGVVLARPVHPRHRHPEQAIVDAELAAVVRDVAVEHARHERRAALLHEDRLAAPHGPLVVERGGIQRRARDRVAQHLHRVVVEGEHLGARARRRALELVDVAVPLRLGEDRGGEHRQLGDVARQLLQRVALLVRAPVGVLLGVTLEQAARGGRLDLDGGEEGAGGEHRRVGGGCGHGRGDRGETCGAESYRTNPEVATAAAGAAAPERARA